MKRLRQLVGGSSVKPGEGRIVSLLLLHSVGLGLYRAFYISIANTQFLLDWEVRHIPMAYLVSALIGYLAVSGLSFARRRVSFESFLYGDLTFVLLLTLSFWGGFRLTDSPWISFAVFACLFPVFSLLDLQFWGLAGRLFDLRQSKRLFSLIGAGEAAAAILGFVLVPFLYRLVDDPYILLLLAVISLASCLLALRAVLKSEADKLDASAAADPAPKVKRKVAGVKGDRYFLMISVVFSAFIVTSYFADFAFLTNIREQFQSREAIGTFVGTFFAFGKTLELLSRLFFAGWLLRNFGVISGLLVIPLAVLIFGLPASITGSIFGTAALGFFGLVALTKLLVFVSRKSVFEPSFRVLYQPLTGDARLATQARVEGTVKQIATAVAGGLLIVVGIVDALTVLHVMFVLVVVAIAWIAVGRPMFHEYRAKLMATLRSLPKKAYVQSPAEIIQARLHEAPTAEIGYTFNVLGSVDPALLEEASVDLLSSRRPEVRSQVLERIQERRSIGAAAAVARLADEDEVAEVRRLAERTGRQLRELQSAQLSPQQISELAISSVARDRVLAAVVSGAGGSEANEETLSTLLWDQAPEVRRAAVAAAGRLGNPVFWPRLIELLSSGEFFKAAGSALIQVGEPVVEELELAFSRFPDDPRVLTRIVRIFERVGGAEAEQQLFERIGSPTHGVRQQALLSLSTMGFQARPDQVAMVKSRIEKVIDAVVWFRAALRDLGEGDEVAQLAAALEAEVARPEGALYLLLTLISDPQGVRLMQEHLTDGTAEEQAYALEIAEQLVPEDLRETLLPVFEQLPGEQLVDRLKDHFPQPALGRERRILELLRWGANRVDSWTRACAIEALVRIQPADVADELAASLFSSDPMIRELAAWAVFTLSPEEYRRRRADLTAGRLVDFEGWKRDEQPRLLIYERVQVLENALLFSGIRYSALVALAAKARELRLDTGTVLFRDGDPGNTTLVVVRGDLRIDKGEVTLSHIGAGGILGEIATVETGARTATATVVEPATLLEIDREAVFDLLAENMEIMPGMIEVIALRRQRG